MTTSPTIQQPHGRVFSSTCPDPAPGSEILEVVPARRRWILHAIRFILTTDGNDSSRFVHLILDDGTNIFLDICVTAAHAKSTTKIYNFSSFGSTQLEPNDCLYIPLPPLPLKESYRIRTITDGIQVGDDYTAPQLLVEEWIDP